jgi:hypothetical protein
MISIMSQIHWSYTFLFLGSLGLLALVLHYPWMLISTAAILSFAHGMIATCFLLGNPTGVAPFTYANVALLGFYLMCKRILDG